MLVRLAALPIVGISAGAYRVIDGITAASAADGGERGPGGGTGPMADAAGGVTDPVTPASGSGPPWTIAEENARPGTTDWQISQDPKVWERIRGYASVTSAQRGERVALFVSTAARSFTATAFRMGYYGGRGGRRIWSSGPVAGRVQVDARIERATNTRDAPWQPSVWLTLGPEFVPGAYLITLVADDGGQSQIPLVVRDDARAAAVHIQHDVTTWQAYNRWGGASLYEGQGGRSVKVCFDRPYDLSGSGNFLGGVFEITALVESLGLDCTHSTNIDSHVRPELMGRHKVWISPAHDEYWSLEMRNGVEAARDGGTNLMFLGANCMYRRVRFEDTYVGHNRLMVNYRSAKADPLTGIDDARVTTSWREAPAARPESSVTGTYYESNPVHADMVVVDADAWMFAGTGVRNGDRWADVVGNEYDRVTLEAPTPPTIQVLAHSPVRIKGKNSFADMTYYTAPSGAGVFSAGSIWFERHVVPGGTGTDAQISAMVTNILRAFAEGPAGVRHPAVPNLDRLGIRRGYLPRID